MIQLVIIEENEHVERIERAVQAAGSGITWVAHNLAPAPPLPTPPTPPPPTPAPAPQQPMRFVGIQRNAFIYTQPRSDELGIVFGASVSGGALKVPVYTEQDGFLAISPARDLWIPTWAVSEWLYQATTTLSLQVRDEDGKPRNILPVGAPVFVYAHKSIPGFADRAVISPPGSPEQNVWVKGLKPR